MRAHGKGEMSTVISVFPDQAELVLTNFSAVAVSINLANHLRLRPANVLSQRKKISVDNTLFPANTI